MVGDSTCGSTPGEAELKILVSGILALPILLLSYLLPANADWREEIGVFRIGMVIDAPVAIELARIEPFRLALVEAIGMEVEFFTTSSARPLLDALAGDRIEYALLSASGHALASVTCECVEPLVMPRATDGTDSYHIVALARTGNPVSVPGLAASRNAILSSDGVLGVGFISFLLAESGDLYQGTLIEAQALASSEETIEEFASGQYDVLFGWSSLNGEKVKGYSRGTLKNLYNRYPESVGAYDVIWRSPPIPHRPHTVRKKLPGELKNLLRDFMVNLYERNPLAYDVVEPIYGGGFTAARNMRFRLLERYLSTFAFKPELDETLSEDTN